jgi:phospholipid transport system substrate-binding protein
MTALRYLASIATLTLTMLTGSLFPQDVSPEVLVKNIAKDVMAAVKADKDLQAGDQKKLADLADNKINSHFDFRRMTQSAMARNWRIATPEQQDRITNSFKILLVGTYSRALVSYRDRTIEFRALHGDSGSDEATVRSELTQSGQQPTVIDYDLGKSVAGWRIYDIRVDGASLIVTYRDSFANEIRNHGIDGLIASLDSKNAQNLGGAASATSDAKHGNPESK